MILSSQLTELTLTFPSALLLALTYIVFLPALLCVSKNEAASFYAFCLKTTSKMQPACHLFQHAICSSPLNDLEIPHSVPRDMFPHILQSWPFLPLVWQHASARTYCDPSCPCPLSAKQSQQSIQTIWKSTILEFAGLKKHNFTKITDTIYSVH